jgi:ATP-dependent 26S proteasome regulatory subunit
MGISNLLNLGDGLLGDALQLKLICTFNCDLSKIDTAIMRKGRLAYRYEFDKLDVDKTNSLFIKHGIEYYSNEKMTLTDIFNLNHDNNTQKKVDKVIGFTKKIVLEGA